MDSGCMSWREPPLTILFFIPTSRYLRDTNMHAASGAQALQVVAHALGGLAHDVLIARALAAAPDAHLGRDDERRGRARRDAGFDHARLNGAFQDLCVGVAPQEIGRAHV